MNLVDLAAIGILIGGLLLGFRSGALPQIFGLLGAGVAVGLLIVLAPAARDLLIELEPPVRAIAALVGVFAIVGFGEALGSGLGSDIRRRLGYGLLSAVDRVLGSAVGVAQGLVLIWLVGGLLASGPFISLASQAQRSVAVRTLTAVFPAPTSLAADLRRLLDASGVPQLFAGLEPFPAEPVALPSQTEATALARPALRATVRVEASACKMNLTGTGFAIAPTYVVTNAHVIAGATKITVRADGRGDRRAYSATPVFFDPDLDIALLRVPGLDAATVALAPAVPPRSTKAAAIGHPGGGKLSVIPAGITSSYPARGMDLYGDKPVDRIVIELRGDIMEGDSGGPLVIGDGTVGGVVFAEARNDEGVGYALSPVDVGRRVKPAVGRTAKVEVGPCAH